MKRRLLFLVSLPILFLTSCHVTSSSRDKEEENTASAPSSNEEIVLGMEAPEVAGVTTDGTKVALSQFRGKVVLIDFWAPRCIPCRELIPHEKQLTAHYKNRPFALLGVSFDSLEGFLEKNPLPWPNIIDEDAKISQRWKVEDIPTFVLIDHQSVIIGRWRGGGEMDEIEEAIAQAVKNAERKSATQR